MGKKEQSTGRRKVEDILMNRDGISRLEAAALISDCVEALERGEMDAIEYYLGLEDDYIFDII